MQYGLFLKGIGLTLEQALEFWKKEFIRGKVDADKVIQQKKSISVRKCGDVISVDVVLQIWVDAFRSRKLGKRYRNVFQRWGLGFFALFAYNFSHFVGLIDLNYGLKRQAIKRLL